MKTAAELAKQLPLNYSWVEEDTFIHEFVHYLNSLEYGDTYKSYNQRHFKNFGPTEYYNSPEEYNAYYVEGVNEILKDDVTGFVDTLTESKKNALERWLETKDNDPKILRLKEEIKLILYNKKHIPLETRRLQEQENILIE